MSFTLSQHVIGCSLPKLLNSGSKPELTEKVDDQHHVVPTKPGWIGLVLSSRN